MKLYAALAFWVFVSITFALSFKKVPDFSSIENILGLLFMTLLITAILSSIGFTNWFKKRISGLDFNDRDWVGKDQELLQTPAFHQLVDKHTSYLFFGSGLLFLGILILLVGSELVISIFGVDYELIGCEVIIPIIIGLFSSIVGFYLIISVNKQNFSKIKITMDYGLSPYFFVDWLTKSNGGAIWGQRFMIEVPFSYEAIVTDLEYEIQCMEVILECVREKYPFLQEGKVILFDSGWVKKSDQAALIVQTRVNFVRELFRILKQSSQSPVKLYLQEDGSLHFDRKEKGVPIHLSLNSEEWSEIELMEWIKSEDRFPLEYYSRFGWFFQLVRRLKDTFIRYHGINHSNGLVYDEDLLYEA